MEKMYLKRKGLKSKFGIMFLFFVFALFATILWPSDTTAFAASDTTIDVNYNGTAYTLDVLLTGTVADLEADVATKTSVAVASQKLYFGNYYIGE